MTEIIIGGETFNIVVEGAADAPAVVLAHSLGTNMHVFRKQVQALAHHFRVIRYDLRGHGGSIVSHGPYSIDHLGYDALAILDALNLEKVHWVGLATGGLVGQWLLQHAPERLDRVVLANTAAKAGGVDFWNERIRAVHEKGLEPLATTLIGNWFTRDYREHHPEEVSHIEAELRATSPEGYAAAAAAVRDADFRENLRTIKHPVLVIVGRHDPVAPPGLGALIASTVEGAKLVTLESAQLSPVEAAEAFNHAVVEFLTSEVAMPTEPTPQVAMPTDHTDEKVPGEPIPEAPKKPRKPRAPRPKPELLAAAEPPDHAEPEEHPEPTPEPAPARAPARKRPAKKASAKRAGAKKAPVKKAARKVPSKKRRGRKAVSKKYAVKKAATKKRAVKKPVKKAARKTAAKKTSGRKTVAKKRVTKKSSVRKSPRKTVRRRTSRR